MAPHRGGFTRLVLFIIGVLIVLILLFNVSKTFSRQVSSSSKSQIERNAIRDAARDLARDKLRDSERDREKAIGTSTVATSKAEGAVVLGGPKLAQSQEGAQFMINRTGLEHLVTYKPVHPDIYKKRPPNSYLMIVMVMSNKANRVMRDSQRHSWLRYPVMYHFKERLDAPIRAYFVIGKQDAKNMQELKEENSTYGDLVVLDSDDGPHAQKFIAFIHFLEHEGIHYDFFAKVDTDSFLRPLLLANDILTLPKEKQQNMYLGFGWKSNFDICKEVNHPVFFHTGSTVILSRDILDWVSNHSKREIEHCDFTEDVRTGYWVQEFTKATQKDTNVLQTPFFCHSPTTLEDPNKEHQRCVSYHLGLAKIATMDLFGMMYRNWPLDGREPVPDYFPWTEFEKTLMLYKNEYWLSKEREENKKYTHEIWQLKPREKASIYKEGGERGKS